MTARRCWSTGTRPLERTVYYTYQNTGHVSHITFKDEGYDTVKDLYLAYGTDEKMGVAIAEEWRYDPNDPNRPWTSNFNPDPNDPNQADKVTGAEEFRYESGRRRHLLRYWDTQGWNWTDDWEELGTAWTDYLADEPWSDYDVTLDPNNTPSVTEKTWYVFGLGIHGQQDVSTEDLRYYHDDMLGSTVTTSDTSGNIAFPLVAYTAFGERVWKDNVNRTHFDDPHPFAHQLGRETPPPSAALCDDASAAGLPGDTHTHCELRKKATLCEIERRGRDSNPRYRFKAVRRFSKPLPSATRPPLQISPGPRAAIGRDSPRV